MIRFSSPARTKFCETNKLFLSGKSHVLLTCINIFFCSMVLVVVLIRSGSRVLKTWFGCQVAEQGTLLDLFNDFSAGKIDNSFPFSDTFSTASIECEIGRDKRVLTEFVRISLDVSVGEAVSTLGNYIEYNVI